MKELFQTLNASELVRDHESRQVSGMLSRYSRGMIEVRRHRRRTKKGLR